MTKHLKWLLLLLVALPLSIGRAETISWEWSPTWDDDTAVSAEDQLRMIGYLRLWKEGAPTVKTYFGETRDGVSIWNDNIMALANQNGSSVPGWVLLKAWDNVYVTVSAAFVSPIDSVERDSPESQPVRHMLKGSAVTASISASPTSIVRGSCSTLTWTTQNALSVVMNQDAAGLGDVAFSGSQQVCPTLNTSYTVVATNPGGSTSAVATVAVTAPNVPGCNAPGTLTITD